MSTLFHLQAHVTHLSPDLVGNSEINLPSPSSAVITYRQSVLHRLGTILETMTPLSDSWIL
jgi:hypothetical protein